LGNIMKKRGRLVRVFELGVTAAAILLTGMYSVGTFDQWISARRELREFDRATSEAVVLARKINSGTIPEPPDFTLWSIKRVRAYTDSFSHPLKPAIAVVNVPRLNIRVPVLDGTDEVTLNRGVGWIRGTARPGESGNSGIAGHRDGFFRALKDISEGDEIQLETQVGIIPYKVDQLTIVTPEDVSVLGKRHADSLTLVTCYPFYFVGDAPQRWIVHAVRQVRTPNPR